MSEEEATQNTRDQTKDVSQRAWEKTMKEHTLGAPGRVLGNVAGVVSETLFPPGHRRMEGETAADYESPEEYTARVGGEGEGEGVDPLLAALPMAGIKTTPFASAEPATGHLGVGNQQGYGRPTQAPTKPLQSVEPMGTYHAEPLQSVETEPLRTYDPFAKERIAARRNISFLPTEEFGAHLAGTRTPAEVPPMYQGTTRGGQMFDPVTGIPIETYEPPKLKGTRPTGRTTSEALFTPQTGPDALEQMETGERKGKADPRFRGGTVPEGAKASQVGWKPPGPVERTPPIERPISIPDLTPRQLDILATGDWRTGIDADFLARLDQRLAEIRTETRGEGASKKKETSKKAAGKTRTYKGGFPTFSMGGVPSDMRAEVGQKPGIESLPSRQGMEPGQTRARSGLALRETATGRPAKIGPGGAAVGALVGVAAGGALIKSLLGTPEGDETWINMSRMPRPGAPEGGPLPAGSLSDEAKEVFKSNPNEVSRLLQMGIFSPELARELAPGRVRGTKQAAKNAYEKSQREE